MGDRPETGGWGADDIGDLSGRTAVVTGANSGIGERTALELAVHGAHVVLACRDQAKAQRAADRIVGIAPDASVEVVRCDLASQDSVRAAAADVRRRHDRLDLLVNNAGVMASPFAVTEDGFEAQFATDHLGPFALTGLLLDLLVTTMGARVVTVSSAAHRLGDLALSDAEAVQGLTGGHHRWLAYANAKLANLLFTFELDRRLQAAGLATIAAAVHPGLVRTQLVANGAARGGPALRTRMVRLGGRLGRSPAAGALPTLYAATAPGVSGGSYFDPASLGAWPGPPTPARSSRRSRRGQDAARLWALSEELTGVVYALGGPTAGAGAPDGSGR
ncbi:MAG: oxidoreductase [Acidimicrobiales bacterium]